MRTFIIHGDNDQIAPIGAAGLMSAKIAKEAKLKVYKGGDHGLPTTHQGQFNPDLVAFVRS